MRDLLCFGAVLLAGCSAIPHRDLARLEKGLALRADFPGSVEIGSPLAISYRIVNTGAEQLRFCISETRGLQVIDSRGGNGGMSSLAVHAGCDSKHTLSPGESILGEESVVVASDLLPGKAILHVFVSVVSLRGCSRAYGCYSINLEDMTTNAQLAAGADDSPSNNSLERTNGLRPFAAQLMSR